MPKKVLEFEIPKPIATKKVGNLEIPIYGFVFQSEEAAWESAIADYQREIDEKKIGSTPNVTSTNRIAAALLAERVDPDWTVDEVAKKIPWTFATKLYEIFVEERNYEAKKEEEAKAAATSESSSLPTGDQSVTG